MNTAPPPTRNFHPPVPSDTHDELRKAAERLGELGQCIAEYAAAVGGSRDDLDPALVRAGIETITSDTGRRPIGRRRRQ